MLCFVTSLPNQAWLFLANVVSHNFMAPKRRFWTAEQRVAYAFLNDVSINLAQKEYSHPRKVLQKRTRNALFSRPKSSFGAINLRSTRRTARSSQYKFMVPKRIFWKAKQTFGNAFSNHFSNERSPNRVLTYVKSALKMRSRMFERPYKIFVWGP